MWGWGGKILDDSFAESRLVGKISSRPDGNYVYIGDQKIEFSTSQGMMTSGR